MTITKNTDRILTVLYLLFLIQYTLQAFIFGGLGGQNPNLFIVTESIAILLIFSTLFIKSKKTYSVLRVTAVIFLTPLLVFDYLGSFIGAGELTNIILYTLYSPILTLVLFIILTTIRIQRWTIDK